MSITVRALQRQDIPASVRLHKFAKHNGQNVFSTSFIADITELHEYAVKGQDGAHGFVAFVPTETDDGAEVVGVLTAQLEEQKCVLLTLVVRGDYRGQGVAKLLLRELLRYSRGDHSSLHIITDVAVANTAALTFFKRQGFRQGGRASGRSVELELKACAAGPARALPSATRPDWCLHYTPQSAAHVRLIGSALNSVGRHLVRGVNKLPIAPNVRGIARGARFQKFGTLLVFL